jgi:hypothetical protein
MERTQVPNTYQLGEVCQILAKDNPELRGKSGCWAIVTQVNDFSCHREDLGWRTDPWAEASEVLRISTGGLPADADDLRSHFTGIFEWAGGIGAEVFGVVGEAEAGLFDPVGGKGVESSGVGNSRLTLVK